MLVQQEKYVFEPQSINKIFHFEKYIQKVNDYECDLTIQQLFT